MAHLREFSCNLPRTLIFFGHESGVSIGSWPGEPSIAGASMKKMVKVGSDCGGHRARLMEKRASVLSGLGTRFDTLACMGRVAEDDQAQLSHDEFVSLRMNGLDYRQLRLVDEAWTGWIPGITASAWGA